MSRETKAEALKLFRDSDEHYQRGEFERAVELLRKSYDMYPEPLVLYNLARALEGMGDFTAAVAEYERYLGIAGDVADRRGIERRIATLKDYIAARNAGGNPALPTSPQIDPAAGGGGDRDTGAGGGKRGRRWVPWAVAGGGVAVFAVGGMLGVMSDNRHEAATRATVQTDAARLQDQAKTYATAANILLVGGGAIAIGGAVWGVIRWRRGKHVETPQPGTARIQIRPAYVGVEWTLP